jgi:ribose 5-phosphate isomerase B
MAEALAREVFAKYGLDAEISSTGISVLLGLPASENAVGVMKKEYGLDISGHITKQVLRENLESADYVLAMTERHKSYLLLQAPDMQYKVRTLAQFAGRGDEDVTDPFGGDYECYRQCAAHIHSMIESIAVKLRDELSTKFAVASDHGGFVLKQELIKHLDRRRISYSDFGTHDNQAVDYPVYAKKVVKAMLSGECQRGMLICGTGIGISIAANRYRGIRAAVCHDVFSAKATREHNDANILVMGERVVGVGVAVETLDAFIDTRFSGNERHMRRVSMLDEL